MHLLASIRPFNNQNIIQLSHKSTPYDAFDEIHQVVLDGISDNMDLLFESVKYGAMKKTDTETNRFMLSFSHQKHIHFSITQ